MRIQITGALFNDKDKKCNETVMLNLALPVDDREEFKSIITDALTTNMEQMIDGLFNTPVVQTAKVKPPKKGEPVKKPPKDKTPPAAPPKAAPDA